MIRSRVSAPTVFAAVLVAALAGFGAAAHAQEVDIFYDEAGRRVILDAYTGEVIRIDPPRRRLVRPLYPRELPDDYAYEGPVEDYPPLDEEGYEFRPAPEPIDPEDYPAEPAPPIIEAPPEAEEFPDAPIERQPLEEPTETATAPSLAKPQPKVFETTAKQSEIAAFQVLLDRLGASPGVIDGRMGQNVAHAIDAYREMTGETLDPADAEAVAERLAMTGGPAMMDYTITAADLDGNFIPVVPADYGEKAKLAHLSYTSPVEKLAERFHMDENYLKALNPTADFARPGTVITVANPGLNVARKVVRIIADKGREQVRAYDASGALVAAYPATIGSTDTPSPAGTHTVERIAFDPEYTYNPKINFKQGANDKILKIPPGPNGPVGSIWIALSKPTYGIHGTPEPSTIGKTNSHGCVRLTNWDAQELAKLVEKGAVVEFTD